MTWGGKNASMQTPWHGAKGTRSIHMSLWRACPFVKTDKDQHKVVTGRENKGKGHREQSAHHVKSRKRPPSRRKRLCASLKASLRTAAAFRQNKIREMAGWWLEEKKGDEVKEMSEDQRKVQSSLPSLSHSIWIWEATEFSAQNSYNWELGFHFLTHDQG